MAMPSRSVCMENSTGIAPNDMGTLHSSPRQEAAPFQPHDEITVFIDERSTRFRLACRGDGSWSRLAHESTFAGPT